METSAPAGVPWVVLVAALLALAALTGLEAARRRGASPAPVPAVPARRPAEAARPALRFPHDDLPGFLDAPPGTPDVAPAGSPGPGPADEDPGTGGTGDDGPSGGRVVAAMAAAALVLVAALAGVAVAARDDAPVPAAATSAPAPPPPATTPPPPPPAPPEMPGVPADPLPGEGGAGALANRSVPLGGDGVTARLTFGGIVVERHAVGVTVGYPSVSVTATTDPGPAALAHLRLATWNCMTAQVPEDPAEAGCVRSRTEYADLPAPALTVARNGRDVRLAGRFPSYTRPVATAPAYTGRVYELTVTVTPAGRVRDGRAPAAATLFLGTDRVQTVDVPGLNVVGYAG